MKKTIERNGSVSIVRPGGGKKVNRHIFKQNMIYALMVLPVFVLLIMFHDLPMFGIQIAFRDYTYTGGIWGSEWVGWENFKFFFESNQLSRLLRNTIGYSIASLLMVNLLAGIIGSLLMYEIRSKRVMKVCQTSTLLPNFISVIAVTYILYLILAPSDLGLLNSVRRLFGMPNIDPYNLPNWWPVIIILVRLWQSAGMAALYNFGALIAIDPCLYEAAVLDGANWWQKTRYVSLPGMAGMICMTLITQMGNIMNSSMQQMYLTMDFGSGKLYETADVIATFVYREGIINKSFGQSAAVGLFTSAVGFTLVIITNLIIKKIDPEKAIF